MTDVYDGAVSIRDKLGRILSGEALHVARPLISVVTPTRNRLELLTRTLESLVHQEDISPKVFEVIVVVDGSYDGTARALREMTFPFRFKVIEQVRAGVAVARNTGWRAAAAELVLFLDDDMIASRGLLTQHVKAHRAQPDSVVIGRFSPDSSVRRTAWTRYDELAQEKKYASLGRTEEPSGIRLYTGNVSMPRSALDATRGFDSTLPRNEDIDLGFRLQGLGYKFCYQAAAESLHCGYRDFDGWRSMPLLYGRLDVAMYRDRGFAGGLETIVACFHDRHLLNRVAVSTAISYAALGRMELQLFAWLGLTAHKLHLERISYLSLSAVWNILYWTGVRDGLRGNEPFRRMLRRTRHHRQRPYRRVSVTSPH
jgi:glycosyltransferase involved in cell wall biosynthesis